MDDRDLEIVVSEENQVRTSSAESVGQDAESETLDVAIESPAIRRLLEEVRSEITDVPRSYNRTFNRHNR